MTEKLLLNKKEAAAFLGISVRTLDDLRKTGLPCVPVGGQIKFLYNSLLEWAKSQERAE